MKRHQTKKRMAARMAKRRERIERADAMARFCRSMPQLAAMMQVSANIRAIAAEMPKDDLSKAAKKVAIAAASIKGVELGFEALRIRSTPTEIMQTL